MDKATTGTKRKRAEGKPRTSKNQKPNVEEQLRLLVNAFKCAVTLGANEGEFQRKECRLNEHTQYSLRTIQQERLKQAWEKVGDVGPLLSDWPILDDHRPIEFYGTAGQSSLQVVYRFTEKLATGPVGVLPQYAEGWTQPRIRQEMEVLLARLELERSRYYRGPVSRRARRILAKLRSLPEEEGMDTSALLTWLADTYQDIIDDGTLRSALRELRPYGARNRPKIGYFIRD